MRHTPCGYCPPASSAFLRTQRNPFLNPFFSFSCRERKERFQPAKKRKRAYKTIPAHRAAIASEETRSIPFPANAENCIFTPSFFLSNPQPLRWVADWFFAVLPAPHAILMMAVRQYPTDTVQPCVLRHTP